VFRSSLGAAAVAAAAMLCACGRTEPTVPAIEAAAPARVSAIESKRAAVPAVDPSPAQPAVVAWPPAEMQAPDPRMRRFALEQWAREPTESLDLVAAALVDPEESIRERAEQIFEEALARRR
jgi:hypothetical protein